jgi:hypothetical protein
MALTVGTDSYILLADADAYLSSVYSTLDAKMIAWTALTDANKEAHLRAATKTIDRQPLTGYKVTSTQVLAFPRVVYTEYDQEYINTAGAITNDNWYVQTSVPNEVKYAECEIAIELASGTSNRVELQRQGVKSFSLGKLSETYTGSQNRIISQEAKELLSPYTQGGFRIA